LKRFVFNLSPQRRAKRFEWGVALGAVMVRGRDEVNICTYPDAKLQQSGFFRDISDFWENRKFKYFLITVV